MKLKDLLAGIEVLASTADLETEIPGVCYDSRKVQPGELFVAAMPTSERPLPPGLPPFSASAFLRRPSPMSR